jgi:hypothetical protein
MTPTKKTPLMSHEPSGAGDEASRREPVHLQSSVVPGQQSKEEVKWRPLEAERLDDERLEDLSIEVYGY